MGGPMGVYDNYNTSICQDGGKNCVARDNEGFYGDPRADALAAAGLKDGTFVSLRALKGSCVFVPTSLVNSHSYSGQRSPRPEHLLVTSTAEPFVGNGLF